METIYQDMAARTGGNVYIGIVGPVRTGKSTLIKRMMEKLVIPNISEPHRRERARDELPQCGSGKTIMTSEPKFIPEEAVEICPDGKTHLRVRLIDSVGYMVPGAVGAEEDGIPRMVTTPWFDAPIPMTEAAELGTKKVMEEHCSIGLVVTTDGSITDIPREDYVEAEGRAIRDMQATGKPYLVIINTRQPYSEEAAALQEFLRQTYGVQAAIADCQALSDEGIQALLQDLLYAFPMQRMLLRLPRWIDALEAEHPVKKLLYNALLQCAEQIPTLGQAESALSALHSLEPVEQLRLEGIDLGNGTVSCSIQLPQALFYDVLSSKAGIPIVNDGQLLTVLTDLTAMKAEYSKIQDALASVQATGYGVVMPTAADMHLQAPELVHKGNAYGIKLKAEASSIHMIRVDVDTQIAPMVGDEQQSRDLLGTLAEEDAHTLWNTNLFGKSVGDLVQDSLSAKVARLPEDVRQKFRGTLQRVVNENAQGLICLIL